MGTGNKDPPT